MRDTNYFCVQSWMVTKLNLKGTERDVFAIIHGFTQDDDSECKCSYNYMAEITGYSKRAIIDAVESLLEKKFIQKIESTSNKDQRNKYKCNYSYIENILASELSSPPTGEPTSPPPSELSSPHNINNKISLNKSTGAGASSKNHPRNFSTNKLTDDLCSGIVIDEQKKAKKKESKYDKCLAEIDKREFTDDEKLLLRQHIDWSFHSVDANINNEPRKYAKHLDELLKLNGDKQRIIQQSIDKKWHCFYEYRATSSTTRYETKQDTIKIRDLDEAKRAMKEKEERGVEIF